MKKLLSMFMAIAIFLSVITIPVHAENEKVGSITITNPTLGEEYAIYQIFEASVKVVGTQADGIAYKMQKTTANAVLFEKMFGTDGKTENPYFQYNTETKEVKVKQSVLDTDVLAYLKKIIAEVTDQNLANPLQPSMPSKIATEDTVDGEGNTVKGTLNTDGSLTFSNVPYGYYFVTSSLGSVVSINSTTPDMRVIDKNQKPGEGFAKYVQTGETPRLDVNGNPVKDQDDNIIMDPIWGKENSANISDKISFKVQFEATNYDGMNKIQYYQMHDDKGEGLWVEFNSFKVIVDGEELDRGYYIPVGDPTVLNAGVTWEYLGTWNGYDIENSEPDPDLAQWYLVHYGFDQFRILIPWLEGHDVTLIEKDVTEDGVTKKQAAYTLTYKTEDPDFLYNSPSKVEVYYDAGVEYNASIGNGVTSKLFNTAQVTWTFGNNNGSTKPDTTETKVYGIGITKVDGANDSINLAGAKFKVYRKVGDGKEPVFVIPTDVKGVYVVDSLNTFVGDNLTGYNRQPTRKIYEAYLAAYLGDDYVAKGTQKNIVTSEVNGKFVILGLSEGTYYLEEIEAPEGYNVMTHLYEMVITKDNSTAFSIYADKDGNVANISGANDVYSEIKYSLVSDMIENGKGATLPTTGAEGTIKMITIGTFITIACGVLLITNKKMSVYRD